MGRLIDNSIVYNIVTMVHPLAAFAASIWAYVALGAAVVTVVTSYQLWGMVFLSAIASVYFVALAYAAGKIEATCD